jgi:hypothetical protein
MPDNDMTDELEILQGIIARLRSLDEPTRIRLLQTVATFFKLDLGSIGCSVPIRDALRPAGPTAAPLFSEREEISPKEFLMQKQPRTDVERIACLAYYLTHLRKTPHFKTADVSILNTEGAQPRFANAAHSVDNATKMGYLVPGTKGHKQLGAMGEQFVRALPDREAAKEVLARMKPRRFKKRPNGRVERPEDGQHTSEEGVPSPLS